MLHDVRHVELDARGLHALLGGLLRVLVQLGGVEDRLGGNAAAQGARSPEPRILLDADGLEAQLPSADRGDVSAGSRTDDRHVVLGHARASVEKGRLEVAPGLLPVKASWDVSATSARARR